MADTHPHPHYRDTLYGYYPTRWITALFVALFGLTTIIHTAQATRYRLWWLFPTIVACGVAEVLGWSGRLWSSFTPAAFNPYLMQICTTILAPSFMTAANFIILGRIIQRLGIQYSRLSPRAYSYIFITADVAALVIQAVGGASASQAAQTGIGDPEKGGKIMLGGIIVQMVAITLYTGLAIEFLIRVHTNRPVHAPPVPKSPDLIEKQEYPKKPLSADLYRKAHLMLIGLSISTLFIYIRTIYRTIELNDGWTGRIIQNETYFNTLDGMPIVVAMFTLNFFHPGFLLPPRDD